MKTEITSVDIKPKMKICHGDFRGGEGGAFYDVALVNNLTGDVTVDKQGIYTNAKIVYIDGKPAWFNEREKRVIEWISLKDIFDCCPFLDDDEIEAIKRWDTTLEAKHRAAKRWYENVVKNAEIIEKTI